MNRRKLLSIFPFSLLSGKAIASQKANSTPTQNERNRPYMTIRYEVEIDGKKAYHQRNYIEKMPPDEFESIVENAFPKEHVKWGFRRWMKRSNPYTWTDEDERQHQIRQDRGRKSMEAWIKDHPNIG